MNTNRNIRRNMDFESMEKRELFAAHLGFDIATTPSEPQAAILVMIPGVSGDSTIDGYDDSKNTTGKEWHDTKPMGWDNTAQKKWADSGIRLNADSNQVTPGDYFAADSFSFGVEREMKESGEKGGTEDINIGVGELQECTVSKNMDHASGKLAQFSINGNSCGTAEIDFVEVAGDSYNEQAIQDLEAVKDGIRDYYLDDPESFRSKLGELDAIMDNLSDDLRDVLDMYVTTR